MSVNNWFTERAKALPLHRRIEAACQAEANRLRRTWRRMTYGDREKILNGVLSTFAPELVSTWRYSYALGDVLNQIARGRA